MARRDLTLYIIGARRDDAEAAVRAAGPRGAKLSVNSRGQRSLWLSKLGFFFRKKL